VCGGYMSPGWLTGSSHVNLSSSWLDESIKPSIHSYAQAACWTTGCWVQPLSSEQAQNVPVLI